MSPSGAPVEPQSGAVSTVNVQGSFVGNGPQLYARKHRVSAARLRELTFTSYTAMGTLYPSDAGMSPITQSGPATFSGGVYSATLSFSNVPVHNNEWIVMEFAGKASDGSTIDLGELAGVVNVAASPTNSASLTQLSTQRYEAFAALLATGIVSTYQIDSNATLMTTTIPNAITASGAVLDPSTGLYDAPDLIKILNAASPALERKVTITPNVNTKGAVLIVRDYTNQSELNLSSNSGSALASVAVDLTTSGSQVLKVGSVLGGGFGFSLFGCGMTAGIVAHTVANVKIAPLEVGSCIIPNPTGGATTVANVYTGNILVGASNNNFASSFSGTPPAPPPFSGGWVSVVQSAPGTVAANVTVASTGLAITTVDPAGFAFPTLATFTLQPNFGNSPLSQTAFLADAGGSGWRVYVPPTYATTHTVTVDTFNAWKIPASALCSGISCFPVAAGTFTISRIFNDPGTSLAYFAWAKSGTVSAISSGAGNYNITISGAGTGTLTSTKATVLNPQQSITITSSLPNGTVFTITAHDASANTYTNSGVLSSPCGPCGGTATVQMASVGNTTNITSIAISFNTTAAGSFTIAPFQ